MGQYTFKLPDIGEGIAEAEIAAWRVEVGDVIKEDHPLVDMLTDKAAVEIPSPVAGKILSLHGAAGDKVSIGAALAVIEVEGAGNAAAMTKEAPPSAKPAAARPAPKPSAPVASKAAEPEPEEEEAVPAPATGKKASSAALPRAAGEKPIASPAVRRRALEAGVPLSYVHGSGPAGRITQDDLEAFLLRGDAPVATGHRRRDGIEEVKIIGLRRKIAEAMQRSKQRIPHFAYVEEVDVTDLEILRARLNADRRKDQPKLTMLPFLMQALTKALVDFPQLNARFDDEAGIVQRYAPVHIGIATQTERGLVVPVVRHAEAMTMWEAATEITRLADVARAGKGTREELSGSTITISSLGPLGGIVTTPVINAPEVAIIGVNKIVEKPVVRNGQIVIRQCMNLSSSFDHRVVDGWDAARFIQQVRGLLEVPATLFMD